MTECELCAVDSCVLDFGKPCCVARYIARLKSLEQRQGWLARFRKRKEKEFMERVEMELLERWKAKKRGKKAERAV